MNLCMKSENVFVLLKTVEQYFKLVLFIILYNEVQTFSLLKKSVMSPFF